jgi:hypothetical protein
LPLSELQRVAQLVRGTLRSIALVLTDEGPGRQSGRVKRFIETSVDLEVVGAPRAGSFVLDMEVPPSSAKDQPDLELRAGPHIGDRAVRALVSGLAALDEDTVQLPEGFDRGVLQAVAGLRNTLIRGVDRVVLTTSGNEGPEGRAEVDASRVALVKTLISRPIRSHAIAEGTLRMVDDATLECRLERPPLPSITCFFEDKDRDAVWEAAKGRQHVRVIGEGEYLPGESHPRRLWAASITVVSEVLPFDPDAFWLPRSLDDLADEQAVQTFSPRPLDDEWRDDAEAAALIAALADDERHGHGH